MTLGSSPTIVEILDELGESLPYTFPDAKTRWLGEVGASDPITFPTSFSNKQSVKIEAQSSIGGTFSGTCTFSSSNFGIAYSGRTLVACICLYGSTASALDISSVTIGGVSAVGRDNGEFLAGGPVIGAGIFAASVPSGTSGNVVVNFTNTAIRAVLVLLSIASISTTAHDEASQVFPGTGGNSASDTINIPSNGVLIVAASHTNTNNTTLTGVNERTEVNFGPDLGTFAVGFDNRKTSGTQAISSSWSGNAARGFQARSFAQ